MSKNIYTRKKLKNWICANIINENGKINPNAGRISWWEKHHLDIFEAIKKETDFIQLKNITGYIHVILQDIYEIPKCLNCKNKVVWQHKGFTKFCSPSCSASFTGKRETKEIKEYKKIEEQIDFEIKQEEILPWLTENIFNNIGRVNNWKTQDSWWTDKPKIFNVIKESTQFLDLHSSIHERIYCILNNIKSLKICNCGRPIKFKRGSYRTNCSSKCNNQKQFIPERTKNWYLKHEHLSQEEIGKIIKLSATCINKDLKKFGISRKASSISKGEREVLSFIEENYNGKIIDNSKKIINPQELDIYLPELNLAFEYNGLYWHSELQGTNKNYHLNKTNLCKEKNIRLVHIFDNEWLNKQAIVKSRIISLLGKSKTIFARKCIIKEVNFASEFLNENHIQGKCNSSINLGLYYNEELVALMTFGKARFNKNIEWELLRFCNKLNTSVVGGASKLYKYFQEKYNPKSIISYSDKRWNTGKLYKILGLEKQKSSPPNYWYFKAGDIFSRVKFQKHKLQYILDSFDPVLTEWQNMQNNGWNRIWDCGNEVYLSNLVKREN